MGWRLVSDILDELRGRLALSPGVVLSDQEIALALRKVPKAARDRASAEVDNLRFDVSARQRLRKPRKFGGVA